MTDQIAETFHLPKCPLLIGYASLSPSTKNLTISASLITITIMYFPNYNLPLVYLNHLTYILHFFNFHLFRLIDSTLYSCLSRAIKIPTISIPGAATSIFC